MGRSELRIRLSEWESQALEIQSNKTGMDLTNIARQAILEYVERHFTKYDFASIEEITDSEYKNALDEWVHLDLFIQKMDKRQATLFKKFALIGLEYIVKKKQMPQYKELWRISKDLNEVEKHYPLLQTFLWYQIKIIQFYNDIPLPEFDVKKTGDNTDYFSKKWYEYAELLIDKMNEKGRVIHPFYYALYCLKGHNDFVTDREIALFLMERIAEILTGKNEFNLKDYVGSESQVKNILKFLDKKEKGRNWGNWYLELLSFLNTAKKAEVITETFDYHSVKRSKEMAEDFAKRLEKEREAEEKREYNRKV